LSFNFNVFNENISTKNKTIILVLTIFFILSLIFVYLRYLDTRNFIDESRAFYQQRVSSVYKETIKRTAYFYSNRGSANLNSFGVTDALDESDIISLNALSKFRWKVLKNENNYLKSMAFYDKNGHLLTSLGEKVKKTVNTKFLKSMEKKHGFWIDKEFRYRIIVNSKKSGYIVFTIDPKYFLDQIQELTGFEGYMLLQKSKNNTVLINLRNDQTSDIAKFLKEAKNNELSSFKNKTSLYAVHRIQGESVYENSSFQSVFFQNIDVGQNRLNSAIYESIIMVLLLGVITFVILHYGFKVLILRLEDSNIKLQESEKKLKLLNHDLQKRVEEEIEQKLSKERESKEKERMLIHQSKLASMGEMIGNIAHQWRQPLAQVGVILIGLELFHERGKLTFERLKTKIKEAETQINYMSKTIDDFRNFFVSEKQKETFNVKEKLENTITLISASLNNNNISCQLLIEDDIHVNGYPNEIAQVVLNILSNAKDVLLERKIKKPSIVVTVSKKLDKACINICDNAGGIKMNPIEKIFEPYVSSKHASVGTGIGLYMSKTITEKNNGGSLMVSNIDKGACFTILL